MLTKNPDGGRRVLHSRWVLLLLAVVSGVDAHEPGASRSEIACAGWVRVQKMIATPSIGLKELSPPDRNALIRREARDVLAAVGGAELIPLLDEAALVAAAECAEFCHERELQLAFARAAVARSGSLSPAFNVLVRGVMASGAINESATMLDQAVGRHGIKSRIALMYGQLFHGYRQIGDYGAAQVMLERYFEACAVQLRDDARICLAVRSNWGAARDNSLLVGGRDRWERCRAPISDRVRELIAYDGERLLPSKDVIEWPVMLLLFLDCEREQAAKASHLDDVVSALFPLAIELGEECNQRNARLQQFAHLAGLLAMSEANNVRIRYPRTFDTVEHVLLRDDIPVDSLLVSVGKKWQAQRRQSVDLGKLGSSD